MRRFPPDRIVCLTDETVETLYLLGEQVRIVGVSGYAVRPPQVRRETPCVSAFTRADIPEILALDPDLAGWDGLGFVVTVNSDNQLMSRTTLSKEFAALCDAFDYTLDDVRWFTINAAKSAFYPFDVRLRLIEDVIKPGFAALGAS